VRRLASRPGIATRNAGIYFLLQSPRVRPIITGNPLTRPRRDEKEDTCSQGSSTVVDCDAFHVFSAPRARPDPERSPDRPEPCKDFQNISAREMDEKIGSLEAQVKGLKKTRSQTSLQARARLQEIDEKIEPARKP